MVRLEAPCARHAHPRQRLRRRRGHAALRWIRCGKLKRRGFPGSLHLVARKRHLPNFHVWRDWRGLAREVPIAVIRRPGYDSAAHAARAMGPLKGFVHPSGQARHWTGWSAPAIVFLRLPPDPTSATAIRAHDPSWHPDTPMRLRAFGRFGHAPLLPGTPSTERPAEATAGAPSTSKSSTSSSSSRSTTIRRGRGRIHPARRKSQHRRSHGDRRPAARRGRSRRWRLSLASKIKAEIGRNVADRGLRPPTGCSSTRITSSCIFSVRRSGIFYNLERLWAFGDEAT